ncbi:MAG: type II toxin-antitoxin system RelE/ParE family toxin [Planctomycetes bacterium]|nr:type II toxin-antitoxin system RelE/ParE family toxin [Planctomycetota bacterium]
MAALIVSFFRTQMGNEPAREWLLALSLRERRIIGEDLRVVQSRWPLGMPLVRKMAPGLWELRSTIPDGIARLFFTVWEEQVVVLHAFVKKTQKTPENELKTAQRRLVEFTRNTP